MQWTQGSLRTPALFGAALSCVLAIPPVFAQALPPSLDACSAQTDDRKRLACYDREIARLRQLQHGVSSPVAPGPGPATAAVQAAPPPASAPATTGAPAAPVPPPLSATASSVPPPGRFAPPDPKDPAAVDRFGLTPDMQHQRELEGRAPSQLPQIAAQVTSVHYKPRGELIVALDNGQTWEQAEYDGDVPMNVGDKVTIKAGALGAFYLKPHSGRLVRVRRVH